MTTTIINSAIGRQAVLVMQRWESAQRYYVLILTPNLFGEWELIQAWGGKANRLGRVRALPVAGYADGLAAFDRVGRLRKRRGYCLMETRVQEACTNRSLA